MKLSASFQLDPSKQSLKNEEGMCSISFTLLLDKISLIFSVSRFGELLAFIVLENTFF